MEPLKPGGGSVVGADWTGQIVVYKLRSSVVTEPIGQFVTVAGHFVIVWTEVV